MMRSKQAICLMSFMLVLGGCSQSPLTPPAPEGTGKDLGPKFVTGNSDAGVPLKSQGLPTDFTKLVAANGGRFTSRSDPFALKAGEKTFDQSQASQRFFTEGGFTTLVTPAEQVVPPIYVEPQPYRRLAGIVVGDSVLAILETADGQEPVIIRPGMRIPNTPWTVVSIDQDKAVLRRSGNVLPHEVIVRLESAPAGTLNNVPTNNPGGFPPGGPPPSGGFRGPTGGGGKFGGGARGGGD